MLKFAKNYVYPLKLAFACLPYVNFSIPNNLRLGFAFEGRVGIKMSGILPSCFRFLRVKVRVGFGLVRVLLFVVRSGSGIKMLGILPSGFGFSGPRLGILSYNSLTVRHFYILEYMSEGKFFNGRKGNNTIHRAA